jgi:hypothetical protein
MKTIYYILKKKADRASMLNHEFTWLLRNHVTSLEKDDLVPDRFSKLAYSDNDGSSSSSSQQVTTTSTTSSSSSSFAQGVGNELVPGGQGINVTESSKRGLVRLWLRRKLIDDIRPAVI